LIKKAQALYALQEFDKARLLNAEGLKSAEEIGRQTLIFLGKILAAKIEFQTVNGVELKIMNGVEPLAEMLAETEDESEKADLLYELWRMKRDLDMPCPVEEPVEPDIASLSAAKHRQDALKLYQKLYNETPNIVFKNRIDELEQAAQPAIPQTENSDGPPEDIEDALDSFI